MSPRLAFAVEAATRAGRLTLGYFQNHVAVDIKGDETPVTVADREAEKLLRKLIAEAFPGDEILGEEEGGDTEAPNRWVLDPIDGTKSFVAGVPLYGTLVSYEVDRVPVLGVAYLPALNDLVFAERGSGCFWNGRPCRVSSRPSVKGGVVCSSGHSGMLEHGRAEGINRLSQVTMATRTWGDAFGYALVATGRVEAMIDPAVSRWDLSAFDVIIPEAGGRFTDFDGNPVLKGDSGLAAVATNGLVHQEVLAAFR